MKPTKIVNGNDDEALAHKIRWGTMEKIIVGFLTSIFGIIASLISYEVISTASLGAQNNMILQRVVAKQESDEAKLERVLQAVEQHVAWANKKAVELDKLTWQAEETGRKRQTP